MFKSCGNIIFWQKLCSLSQAMPSGVSFRRGMVFREISHMVHLIHPLTHFGFGAGIWTRVLKGTECAGSLADGCSMLPSEGHPTHTPPTNVSRPLFSKCNGPTMLFPLKASGYSAAHLVVNCTKCNLLSPKVRHEVSH